MKLQTLDLTNFRSYSTLQLTTIGSDVHVFVGDNGVGKTNIIEAITLLSLTKSFQSREDIDLITWNESFYKLQGVIHTNEGNTLELEVASQIEPRKKKAFYKNGIPVMASAIVGSMPTVLFVPQDLDLFTGSPQRRRQFLDQLLCQVSPLYLQALSQYQKVMKQRNALLKKIAAKEAVRADLAVWNSQLALHAASITLERLRLMEIWQLSIEEELHGLGEHWSEVQFIYNRKTTSATQLELQKELEQLLDEYCMRDVLLQSTTVGPHREDWGIQAAGKMITSFASRGQQRTAMLALLLLETSFLEVQLNDTPIVLLDDVFSELDVHHQKALLHSLTTAQVFITTAVAPPTIAHAQLWHVELGSVTQVS